MHHELRLEAAEVGAVQFAVAVAVGGRIADAELVQEAGDIGEGELAVEIAVGVAAVLVGAHIDDCARCSARAGVVQEARATGEVEREVGGNASDEPSSRSNTSARSASRTISDSSRLSRAASIS